MIVFDIETGPQPGLADRIPDFDPASVKLGKLKDQAKIDVKLAEAKRDHAANFLAASPLDPAYGCVLAIGYHKPSTSKTVIDSGDESELLDRFWKKAASLRTSQAGPLVGLNIYGFDLPFMRQRSFCLGVPVPDWVISQERFWHPVFLDLRQRWLSGQSWGDRKSNFDYLAEAFGTGGKPDGVDGSMFHELWESDRERAIAYLTNDLLQPAAWAKRMGIY